MLLPLNFVPSLVFRKEAERMNLQEVALAKYQKLKKKLGKYDLS